MKGSCLCGAIEYAVDQLDAAIGHCHCRTCRKAHSAAFASTARVNQEHFHWIKGKEKLSSFESSPGKLRQFCSVCGSHLVAVRLGQPYVILRVGSLDDDPGVKPQYHIWTSHHAPWLDYEGLPEHAEWQPGR